MRRTDRLFDLIQILRAGGLFTARALAERLEVSTRTVWRDMATLIAAGLPIEGARGVGYILRAPIALPPMTLTDAELTALRTALALLGRGADPSLADAAARLAGKIEAVLPESLLARAGEDRLFVWPGQEALAAARHLPALRMALRDRAVLDVGYGDAAGAISRRAIRPLGLEFWGRVWTLAAWCETRDDFRSFRVDRIASLADTGRRFAPEPGRDLATWQARMEAAGAERLDRGAGADYT